jgi:hypothetical protein
MTGDPTPAPLAHVAKALDMPEEQLSDLALDLFGQWLSGQRRFPTLSQQNQEWYRAILSAAGKSNPSREDLKNWFGLPHGTAQYLAGVYYDPEADRATEQTKADIARQAVAAITEAGDGQGLGPNEANFYLSPKMARSLETLLFEALADTPMAPPVLTRLAGTVKVSFSANRGLKALCLALGDQGGAVQQAAKAQGSHG